MFHSLCTIHPLTGSLFSHYKILCKVLPAVTHSHVSNLLHFNSFCSSIMLGHQPWSWSSACVICFNRPTGYISDILAASIFLNCQHAHSKAAAASAACTVQKLVWQAHSLTARRLASLFIRFLPARCNSRVDTFWPYVGQGALLL